MMEHSLSRWVIAMSGCALLAGCGGDHQGVSREPLEDARIDARDVADDIGAPSCQPLDAAEVPSWVSWPASGEAYEAETLYYVSALDFPALSGGEATCCEDYGENSPYREGYDNAFAALVETLYGYDPALDFQGYFTRQLEAGALVMLWDLRASPSAGEGAVMASLRGSFGEGTDYALATTGGGRFSLQPEGFVGETGEPVGVMGPASLEGGVLEVGRGELDIRMPLYGVNVDLLLENVTVRGEETLDAAGNRALEGELAATLGLEELFEAFNDFVLSEQCACLGLSEALYRYDASSLSWEATGCVGDAAQRCSEPSNEDCALLGGSDLGASLPQICELAAPLFMSLADVDTDCDGERDAISMGFHVRAYPAESLGLAP